MKPQNIGESRLLAQRAAPSYHVEVTEPRHDKTNKVTVRQSLRCPHEESLGSLLPIAKTDQTGRTVTLLVLSNRGSVIMLDRTN